MGKGGKEEGREGKLVKGERGGKGERRQGGGGGAGGKDWGGLNGLGGRRQKTPNKRRIGYVINFMNKTGFL